MTRYDKFNFVIFLASSVDYYKIIFYDAYALSNVRVININTINTSKGLTINFMPYCPSNNPVAFKSTQSFNINRPQVFAEDFPIKEYPLVFFFWANEYDLFRSVNFFDYLRINYPNCKLVCWLTNTFTFYQKVSKFFLSKYETEKFISTFDCVITYNLLDAINYNFTYFDGIYSVLPFEQFKEKVDIFFVGRPKDRLEKILKAYECFKAAGFVCDFYINDISNPPKIESAGLHFNHFLSYTEVIMHVLRSRGIFDIAYTGTYGLTLRYLESLAYNKNFITNNAFYGQDRFSSPKLFLVNKSYDIDKKRFMNAAELSSNYKNEYSPLRFLSFLESVLNS